jgi:hypothetical protein
MILIAFLVICPTPPADNPSQQKRASGGVAGTGLGVGSNVHAGKLTAESRRGRQKAAFRFW